MMNFLYSIAYLIVLNCATKLIIPITLLKSLQLIYVVLSIPGDMTLTNEKDKKKLALHSRLAKNDIMSLQGIGEGIIKRALQ